ncbi:putative disease resistance protein RGA1 [Senna tora]|uniref:Putative disease resistance protein RGA1 n=1 Tax=Senna tora TaxID=362788 RepID=A0A835CK34_9FABA|nr:putative disease resistance protein RGA1 [Senna tora]
MAEALLGVVLENLSSFDRDELATFWGVNGEVQRLTNSLKLIQAVIVDAEQKEITKESIKIWLQQLKDAAHVLDDMLDEYSIRSNRFSLSSIKPNNIRFRYHICKRLKEITQRLDQISEDGNKYCFVQRQVIRERPINVLEWRQTSSIIAQPQIYGRDGDKDKIVELLLRQTPESGGLSVYPIVGLGGLGKTTLAQLVYNDQRGILQSIMVAITKQECNIKDLDPLQNIVREKLLQSKSYLLVLDDVWNKNQDKRNQLRSVLPCATKGASVLVTTRELDVASIMRTHHTYHLSSLSEDDCWSIFKQRAFPNDAEVSDEVEEIGREIVKKCGGLPLAAQALGSLLQSKSDKKQWLEVKESELWNLQDEKSILPALRLSYFSLTPTLRRCFAFCAIFHKDELIEKEELVHLWMTNGFISSREKLEIEDVGNEIWNELYHKSLFQEVTTDDEGCIRFKMHDLVHDLAQSVTGKECSVIKGGDITNLPRSTHHIRHLIILECPAISCMPPSIGKLSRLRTLNLFIVRSEEGHSLKELHDLNLCQRELSIKGLKCVGSVDEAKGVNLIGIKELRVLSLSWDNSEESEIKAVGVDVEQVIEAL